MNKRRVKFKVVTRWRTSCIVHDGNEYNLEYPKGAKVYARPETLGVLVFDKKCQAQRFIGPSLVVQEQNTILRVRPISRGKKVTRVANISYGGSAEYQDIYLTYFYQGKYTCTAPTGTMCYPGVEVLT